MSKIGSIQSALKTIGYRVVYGKKIRSNPKTGEQVYKMRNVETTLDKTGNVVSKSKSFKRTKNWTERIKTKYLPSGETEETRINITKYRNQFDNAQVYKEDGTRIFYFKLRNGGIKVEKHSPKESYKASYETALYSAPKKQSHLNVKI